MATTQNLFPTYSVPTIETPTAAQERKYRRSLYFDFDTGDSLQDGAGKIVEADGREAYKQWCMKVAMTERFTRLAYTTDIGTEMIDALAQEDREAVQSAIERTITEALMVNPKTEYVRGFAFTWESDSLFCTCVVKGQDWEEFPLALPAEQEVKSIG